MEQIRRKLAGVLILGLVSSLALAQSDGPARSDAEQGLTAMARLRMEIVSNGAPLLPVSPLQAYQTERKSPFVAGVLSLAIPGAGELYTENYLRAGAFFLAEAGLWSIYAAYTSKGNNQTDLFESYADDHWSAVRYAQWIEQNLTKLNPDVPGFSDYLLPGTEGRPPWEQVNWVKINAIESQIAQRSGNGFTHLLPRRPEQQYFELIGKYPQFAAGWDDAGVMTPERILSKDVSQRFLDYSRMRGKANDFFNIATTGAALIVANHVLSALDAAWSASQYNRRVELEARLLPTHRTSGLVELVPTASLTVHF